MTREELLREIIERELIMFQSVPAEGGQANCQKRPETFRLMRQMAHCTHGRPYLLSYLEDLRAAEETGRNFMLEKYARMDDLLPPLSNNPLIDKIVSSETEFLEEAKRINPQLVKSRGSDMFGIYLRSELETLSDATLKLYWQEIQNAVEENINPVLQRHIWLANALKDTNKQG